jgi:hypothetical protein
LEDSLRTFAIAQAIPRGNGRVRARPLVNEREPALTPRRRPGVTDSIGAPDRPARRRPQVEP